MVDGGRPFGAVARDCIIGFGGSTLSVGGPHRNHIRIVTGGSDSAVPLGAVRIVAAVVARRDNYDDAGLPRRLNLLTEGIERVTLKHGPAKRQIDNADVVRILQIDGTLDASDDVGLIPASRTVKHAQVDYVGIRCNAFKGAREDRPDRARAIGSDNPSDVSSVSVSIRSVQAGDEALAVNNTGPQIALYGDSGINYRDSHAGPSV